MSHTCANESHRGSSWYRGRRLTFASIFLLLLPLIVLQRTVAQEAKGDKGSGSISGRITVQGKPAPGLELELCPSRGYIVDKAIATIKTDEEGRYRFANVPANQYWLRVNSREYVSPGERRVEGSGRSVAVADRTDVIDADLDMIVGGAVSGRITDIDGNPVTGEMIHLDGLTDYAWRGADPLYAHEFETNGNGEYRIYGIPPGRYLVSVGVDLARLTGATGDKNDLFHAQGRVGAGRFYEQIFYPGTPNREAAHSLEIFAASETEGINLTVGKSQRSFTARGRVIDAQTGKPLPGKRHLSVSHRLGDSGYVGTLSDDQVNEDGSFEITGLLAERYFASVVFKGDSDLYSDKVEFAIKDADISGLEIKVQRGFTLTGSVVIDGETPGEALAKRGQLKLSAMSPLRGGIYASMHREAAVNADGTFKLIGMPRGPVEISATHCDTCEFFTLARVEYPKGDAKNEMQVAEDGWTDGYRLVHVDRNMQGVRVVLRYKGGSIRCHVNVIGTLPPGVALMVDVHLNYPGGKGGWGGWINVDANGDAIEMGLEPGTYELTVGDGSRRFSQTRRVTVQKNQPAKVSFTIDASKIQPREY